MVAAIRRGFDAEVHGVPHCSPHFALKSRLVEGRKIDDRLFADLQGPHAEPAVEMERASRNAEETGLKACGMGELQEGVDELGNELGRSDRVASDDRDSSPQAVGQDGFARWMEI